MPLRREGPRPKTDQRQLRKCLGTVAVCEAAVRVRSQYCSTENGLELFSQAHGFSLLECLSRSGTFESLQNGASRAFDRIVKYSNANRITLTIDVTITVMQPVNIPADPKPAVLQVSAIIILMKGWVTNCSSNDKRHRRRSGSAND
jgi:hypothetical protein